jgi:hypothetical protein
VMGATVVRKAFSSIVGDQLAFSAITKGSDRSEM